MTEEGGFIARSTSQDHKSGALTEEMILQAIQSIEDEYGYPEPYYLTSMTEYNKIMTDPAPYYKTMRQLLGINIDEI